jgi:AcrR family transcriptional regulator
MRAPNKLKKENLIIDAAEKVFAQKGYKNTRMEDIASVANITKVTLYAYFQSKENLYMAVTYRALSSLAEAYEQYILKNPNQNGLETAIGLTEVFMTFCEEKYLYSEALLDYFSLVRSTAAHTDDEKLTEALKESAYFARVQELHNLPYKITASHIKRGIDDGSINPNVDPMFQTLQSWTMVVGYAKIIASSGDSSIPLFNIPLKQLKQYNLGLKRKILANPI